MLSRLPIRILPDPARVLLRPFTAGDRPRTARIIDRLLAIPQGELGPIVDALLEDFGDRHRDLRERLLSRCDELGDLLPDGASLGEERRLLVGATFSMEYSLEAAALFNPSMVWHPDQSGVPAGARRFILALRATGEGHISSIVFRTGHVNARGEIVLDRAGPRVTPPRERAVSGDTYEVTFRAEVPLGERALFPVAPAERQGIEDARFVRFEDERRVHYLATYTAYDGKAIQPRLLSTTDFLRFRSVPLKGAEAMNKGMALFPRLVGGRVAMLSRQDNENNYLMLSESLERWEEKRLLLSPRYPWEVVQLGNCGSPVETEAGWLVLGHAVGPMRRYVLSAFLLDREDPARVIGRLREPLLIPSGEEREGYVPNVVYSCGGVAHGEKLILPYAVSDRASSFAVVDLPALLAALR